MNNNIWKRLKSEEERAFYHWLLDAEKYGLIENIEYEPKTYVLSEKKTIGEIIELKTKTKYVEKHLLHPHKYTPDFVFKRVAEDDINLNLIYMHSSGLCYIDVKGGYANHGSHGSMAEFSINQKWMHDKYGIYINKVIPKELFKKTWCPDYARYTPKTKQLRTYTITKNINGKKVKIEKDYKDINQFMIKNGLI